MTQVQVELLGISRLVTGEKETTLQLEEPTFRGVVRALAQKYPEMLGNVLDEDGKDLNPPHIFNHNGVRMIREDQMLESVQDGDQITIMAILAGG
ncbi:MAG TPA: hypothetical protein ENN19_01125 [Chloroflexi bacterium]|nr:hypothetical protein [Chloroflexota bacterium]